MPYVCSYKECVHAERKIPQGQAFQCGVCDDRKPFHIACCAEHRTYKHNGGGTSVPLPDPPRVVPRMVRRRR